MRLNEVAPSPDLQPIAVYIPIASMLGPDESTAESRRLDSIPIASDLRLTSPDLSVPLPRSPGLSVPCLAPRARLSPCLAPQARLSPCLTPRACLSPYFAPLTSVSPCLPPRVRLSPNPAASSQVLVNPQLSPDTSRLNSNCV